MSEILHFVNTTGFASMTFGHALMICIGGVFIYLGIAKQFEPLLLIPIGFGIIFGNLPAAVGMQISIYEEGSVLNYLYFGVLKGVYPPLIFLGIGAMTDFSTMLSNPRLILLGAAAGFFCGEFRYLMSRRITRLIKTSPLNTMLIPMKAIRKPLPRLIFSNQPGSANAALKKNSKR